MSGKKYSKPETVWDFNYSWCSDEVEHRKADAEYRIEVYYAELELKIEDAMNSKMGEVVTGTKPINIRGAVIITYELLGLVIERSNNIVSLFKVLENIRIDAWFLSRKDGVKIKIQEGSLAYCGPKRTGVLA
jgi:hypothetical protein